MSRPFPKYRPQSASVKICQWRPIVLGIKPKLHNTTCSMSQFPPSSASPATLSGTFQITLKKEKSVVMHFICWQALSLANSPWNCETVSLYLSLSFPTPPPPVPMSSPEAHHQWSCPSRTRLWAWWAQIVCPVHLLSLVPAKCLAYHRSSKNIS